MGTFRGSCFVAPLQALLIHVDLSVKLKTYCTDRTMMPVGVSLLSTCCRRAWTVCYLDAGYQEPDRTYFNIKLVIS